MRVSRVGYAAAKGTRHLARERLVLAADGVVGDRRWCFVDVAARRVLRTVAHPGLVGMVLDEGFWAGMTLYPETKCTSNRAIDILELYGNERIWMNSACDWGISVPLAVPKAMQEMKRRGKNASYVDQVAYQNPIAFMSQSPRFSEPEGV